MCASAASAAGGAGKPAAVGLLSLRSRIAAPRARADATARASAFGSRSNAERCENTARQCTVVDMWRAVAGQGDRSARPIEGPAALHPAPPHEKCSGWIDFPHATPHEGKLPSETF